jgi:hypothetical protein
LPTEGRKRVDWKAVSRKRGVTRIGCTERGLQALSEKRTYWAGKANLGFKTVHKRVTVFKGGVKKGK